MTNFAQYLEHFDWSTHGPTINPLVWLSSPAYRMLDLRHRAVLIDCLFFCDVHGYFPDFEIAKKMFVRDDNFTMKDWKHMLKSSAAEV